MSRRICGHGRDVVQLGRVTRCAPSGGVRKTAALYTKVHARRAKSCRYTAHFVAGAGGAGEKVSLVQLTRAGRHPAATASLSEQNQRSPLEGSMRTLSYQGLHGMW